jgi:hypothetical protein
VSDIEKEGSTKERGQYESEATKTKRRKTCFNWFAKRLNELHKAKRDERGFTSSNSWSS